VLLDAIGTEPPPDQLCNLLVDASTASDVLVDVQQGVALGHWKAWTPVAKAAVGSLRVSADDVAAILLHDTATPDALLAAVQAIGLRAFRRTEIALRAAVRMTDHPVALEALLTLAGRGTPVPVEEFWQYASHPENKVAAAAVRAAGGSAALDDDRLLNAATDPRAVMRAAAAEALGAMVRRHLAVTAPIAETLTRLLTDDASEVRAQAIEAVSHLLLATPDIDDALAVLASDEQFGEYAVEALAIHADCRAAELAVRWAEDAESQWLTSMAMLTRSRLLAPALESMLEELGDAHADCCAPPLQRALTELGLTAAQVPDRDVPDEDAFDELLFEFADPDSEWTQLRRDEEQLLVRLAQMFPSDDDGIVAAALFLVRRHTQGYEGHDPSRCNAAVVVDRCYDLWRVGAMPAQQAARIVGVTGDRALAEPFLSHQDPAVRFAAASEQSHP